MNRQDAKDAKIRTRRESKEKKTNFSLPFIPFLLSLLLLASLAAWRFIVSWHSREGMRIASILAVTGRMRALTVGYGTENPSLYPLPLASLLGIGLMCEQVRR
jgi:hypothetical protein